MSLRVSEEDVRAHLSEHLGRAGRDDEIVVTPGGGPAVQLRPLPLPGLTGAELADFLRNAPHLSAEEAEAFARDTEEARRGRRAIPVSTPGRTPDRFQRADSCRARVLAVEDWSG